MAMNYLSLLERAGKNAGGVHGLNFLVSGSDEKVRDKIRYDVLGRYRREGSRVIILDDSNQVFDLPGTIPFGFQVHNGLSGEVSLYDPFRISNLQATSRLRQILSILEYRERDKAKLFSYLAFLRHVTSLEVGTLKDLTVDSVLQSCSAMAVEERLQALVDSGVIDEGYRMSLLAKYSECMAAGGDLEDILYLIMPFVKGRPLFTGNSSPEAIVFRIADLDGDEVLKNLLVMLLQFCLEDTPRTGPVSLIICDKGYGERGYIQKLLTRLPLSVDIHMFTKDVFSLGEEDYLSMVFNRFNVRVFSRHQVMSSAEKIEKALGEVDVVKTSTAVSYDRRFRANSPLDIVLNRNKTETVTQLAPVREPRYRKEMISSLSSGCGIIQYNGETLMFSV